MIDWRFSGDAGVRTSFREFLTEKVGRGGGVWRNGGVLEERGGRIGGVFLNRWVSRDRDIRIEGFWRGWRGMS